MYGYGQDNMKQINRARYKQTECFIQDTWKVTRRLTLDYGVRISSLGALYEVGHAHSGSFVASAYSAEPGGSASLPLLHGCRSRRPPVAPPPTRPPSTPDTGATYAYAQQGTFDPASYGTYPFSGIADFGDSFFKTPPVAVWSAHRFCL